MNAGGAAVVRLVYAATAVQPIQVRPSKAAVMLSTVWFTQLGALDLAYELAQAALQEFETTGVLRGANHVATCWLPEMRPFRRDPRFQDYVTRLGLMEYWKQYGPPDACDLKDGKLISH